MVGPEAYKVALVLCGTIAFPQLSLLGRQFTHRTKVAIEFAVPILSAFGLIGVLHTSQAAFADLELSYLSKSRDANGRYLIDTLTFEKRYWCETVFTKTADSPSNFDELVSDQKLLCDWVSEQLPSVEGYDYFDGQDISFVWENFPNKALSTWPLAKDQIERAISHQNDFAKEVRQLKEAVREDGFFLLFHWFAPFFFAAAIGLQLGKTLLGVLEEKYAY